jgi:twitching motility protein PilT
MMALVDLVNRDRHDHIITVEDPIEQVLKPAQCQVSQRELGTHTASFEAALRGALREDPDIIVIGDLRDHATAALSISAAETGHLVFASMPAMSAAKTLDKLVDMFPAGEQATVRTTVSESLRGVLCQRLLSAKAGGRVLAVELLFNTIAVANLIRDGKTGGLKNAMQLGKSQGMKALQVALDELLAAGVITPEVADAALKA